MKLGICLAAGALMLASAAQATEVTTYEYDARGRLVKSTQSGGPASGVQKTTTFDPAGNRTNQTVTGSTDRESFIILPIVGFVMLQIFN